MNETPVESHNQAERQALITQTILEQGSVLVDDLVERFSVSRMTIHRDLDDLERQGVLRKVRNGATAQPSSQFESNVRFRLSPQTAEKEAMAVLAARLIEPGQSILLDEATTLLPLVRRLPDLSPLTVITNFLPILESVKEQPGLHLIGLGGEYLPRFDTFTGLLTEQSVANLHADLYITSTTAVSNGTAFHPDQQVVSVKRAMMKHATIRCLMVDHTKFGKTALHEFTPLSAFNVIIVDAGIEPAHLEALHAGGVRVEVAPLTD
jgi:DeoR/GlpR family transcriptional regulator of sugar metabolism